jgi:hypothetical protein
VFSIDVNVVAASDLAADSYEPLNSDGDDGIWTESDSSASDWSSEASGSSDGLDFDSPDEGDDVEAHGPMLLRRADMEVFAHNKKLVNAMRDEGWHLGTLPDSICCISSSYANFLLQKRKKKARSRWT